MFHLAQVNIARAKFALDDPRMNAFISRLGEINAIAEESPGFIYRFTGDEFSNPFYATRFDRRYVFNLSVWESLETLKEFTFTSSHKELFRDRQEWFERLTAPSLAMWWVPAGHTPDIEEAVVRLDHITLHGETRFAFTFRSTFPAPDAAEARAQQA
jgi:heme-degrading monooxygenase HmoA